MDLDEKQSGTFRELIWVCGFMSTMLFIYSLWFHVVITPGWRIQIKIIAKVGCFVLSAGANLCNLFNQSIKFYLYSPYSQTTVRLIGL